MNELDENNLNDLDLNNSNPNQEVVGQQATQPVEEGFKEMCHVELSNGAKIILGSNTRPVEYLADIVLQLKEKLLDNKKENGGTSYAG
jgi:hypothetical protein